MIFFFQAYRPAQSPLEFTSAQIAKKRKTHTAYRRLVLKRWVFAALLTLANALCWAQKPELIVQTGHTHWVRSVAFSPDGKILASGSIDNTVKLWELKTGREIRSLVGHTGDVSSVAFSSDSKILASASYDHTVKVWDLATGNEIRTLTGHTHVVESVALSSDGKILASGSDDHSVKLWDVGTGKEIRTLSGHASGVMSVAFSPDGKILASGGADFSVKMWNVSMGTEIRTLPGSGYVAFSSDGRILASRGYGNTVKLWDVATGTEIRTLNWFDDPSYQEAEIHSTTVAFSPDGKAWASGNDDHTVVLWGAFYGQGPLPRMLKGHLSGVRSVAFSPDGKTVASGGDDTTVRIWDVITGSEIRTLTAHIPSLSSVAFSPDGKTLAVGSDDHTAKLWDLTGGGEIRTLTGHNKSVSTVVFSPDGKTLATGSLDFAIKLWDVNTGRGIRTIDGQTDETWMLGFDIGFSPDGKTLESHGYEFRLWDVATGRAINIAGNIHLVWCSTFSPDGKIWATNGQLGTVKLWDVATGKEIRTLGKPMRGNPRIESVAFSPDGKTLASGGQDKTIKLWKLATAEELRILSANGVVKSVAFSPNGETLVSGNNNDSLQLWDVASGKEISALNGREGYGRHLGGQPGFSPDGKIMAAIGFDAFTLWDSNTGRQIEEIAARPFGTHSIAFSPDGKILATGGAERKIRLWNIADGKAISELCELFLFEDGTWVSVDPEGRFDTNNLENIQGLHWIFPYDPLPALPLEIFMRDYYEPRLLPRILKGEKFPDLPSVAELNRVQPNVEKISVVPHADNPDLVDVNMKVSSVPGQCLKEGKRVPCESGVYDLRLYRDGQLVRQAPAATVSASTSNSRGQSWREQLQQWRNSSVVKTKEGRSVTVATGKQEMTFSGIRLPRRSDVSQVEFTAYAFNEDRVKSATSNPAVYPLVQPRPRVQRRAYIVTVAVDATSDPSLRLGFAPKGAREVERLLKEKLHSEYEVVSAPLISEYNEDTSDLKRDFATKSNIHTALSLLSVRGGTAAQRTAFPMLQTATPDDLVVLYIASHGYADPNGKFYVVPSDIGEPAGVSEQLLDRCLKTSERSASCQAAREFLQQSISSDELTQWLQTVDAGEMVLVLDSCHSGAVSGPSFKPGPMGDRGFGQLSYDKGMLVLAATQAENVDWGTLELGDRSLLTFALTQQHAVGQSFDVKQWLREAKGQVPELYRSFVKAKQSSASENRPDQEPALFDFSKRRLATR